MTKYQGTDAQEQASVNPHKRSLAQSAAKGAGVMGLGQVTRILIQLGSVVILARMLDASAFGLIAMVTAVIGIAEVFRDFGLAPAAIQAKTLSSAERSNLFWINVLIGCCLAAVVVLTSGIIAGLYGDARVANVMVALASVFVINAVAAQYRAGLSRDLRFGALAVSEIVAQVGGLAIAVTLAMAGAGYWAIVAQQILQAGILALGVVLAGRWLPAWYSKTVPVSRFLKYGSNLLGTQLLVYLSSNIDTILIGARFGAGALGSYNRAFQMIVLPLNQINSPATRVALPVLARLQNDTATFHRYLLRGQLCLTWGVVPIFAFMAANSDATVSVLLGPGWEEVGPLFTVLAFGGIFQTLSYSTYWTFLAKGLTNSNLKFALTTRFAMIALIFVGSLYGVVYVAGGYALSVIFIWLLGLIWIRRVASAPSLAMLREGLLIMVVSSAAAVVSRIPAVFWLGEGLLQQLVAPGLLFITVMGLCIFSIPHMRQNFFDIMAVVKMFLKRGQRKK